MDFKEVSVKDISESVFRLFDDEWTIIASGNREKNNFMTASWGGMGVLWNKEVCFIFIRPQRYTYEFVEKNNFFTLNFFDQTYRGVLEFCGTKSGREYDKLKETSLSPAFDDPGYMYFQQARLVFMCKKLYFQDISPNGFIDFDIDKTIYSKKDYHRMYVGAIERVISK
ncbi:MAG TPA: flavin reductase [Petrotogaceae bacterium]|jgi:flavin reductase (DIM6/NTAB) family NADH-FMN oxidoreductase RutF|nr:flavin reductase [Petrotogaceae bacterium]HNV04543.1 flavin reductase [Petrotogaceae bacterium]HNY37090.1 flavin reductase [Petrotogaceae bacterium]HOG34402.1 flavin reductase [Petrotogaceae bacterium]HPO26132.1 flavin reductase [Petrotogaceae bacterium]